MIVRFLRVLLVTLAAPAALVGVACTGSDAVDFSHRGTAGANGQDAGVTGTSETAGSSGTAGEGSPGMAAAGSSSGEAGKAGNIGASGFSGTGSGAGGSEAAGVGGAAGSSTAGGGGSLDGGANGGADGGSGTKILSFAADVQNLLINNCGGCHVPGPGGQVMGGFAFSYAGLLAMVTPAHADCPYLDSSKRRVVPGKPDNSLIIIKTTIATLPASCGSHMPFQGSMLGDIPLGALRTWILQGANP